MTVLNGEDSLVPYVLLHELSNNYNFYIIPMNKGNKKKKKIFYINHEMKSILQPLH